MGHLVLRPPRAQMKSMDLTQLRPNVGIVLISRAGQVWLGRRAKTPPPYNLQFPQGGVDGGGAELDEARAAGIPFKREVYQQVIDAFRPLVETVRSGAV